MPDKDLLDAEQAFNFIERRRVSLYGSGERWVAMCASLSAQVESDTPLGAVQELSRHDEQIGDALAALERCNDAEALEMWRKCRGEVAEMRAKTDALAAALRQRGVMANGL